jgi:hypothetical protein
MERLPALLLAPSVSAPEIVSCDPLVNEIVPLPVLRVLPPNWRLKQAAFETSTVTVNPPLMITSSPATGAGLPPQVLEALQLPDCELVLVTANASLPRDRIKTITKSDTVKYILIRGLDLMVYLHGMILGNCRTTFPEL